MTEIRRSLRITAKGEKKHANSTRPLVTQLLYRPRPSTTLPLFPLHLCGVYLDTAHCLWDYQCIPLCSRWYCFMKSSMQGPESSKSCRAGFLSREDPQVCGPPKSQEPGSSPACAGTSMTSVTPEPPVHWSVIQELSHMHAVNQQQLSEISSWLDIHGKRPPADAEQPQDHEDQFATCVMQPNPAPVDSRVPPAQLMDLH